MLERTEESNRFKLYASDTGMLFSQYPTSASLDALAGATAIDFGAVYENVVAQELFAAHVPLRYYHHNRKGEVDFIGETEQGHIIAIEVKSGKDYKRHVSLNNLLSTDEYHVACAFVISEANLSTTQRFGRPVYHVPLYMIPFVKDLLTAKGIDVAEELRRSGRDPQHLIVQSPDFSSFNH